MTTDRSDTLRVRSPEDVARVRQQVREWCQEIGFGLLDQTKLVTAASELARNTLIYGGGGQVRLEILSEGPRKGLRLTFEDRGPGIPDIETALRDGYSTGEGLGLGLGGAKRLVSDFDIASSVGQGTTVTIVRWK